MELIIALMSNLWILTHGSLYKDQDRWPEQYSSCRGPHQSPININTKETEKVSMTLELVNYKQLLNPEDYYLNISSTNYLVVLNTTNRPYARGSALFDEKYILDRFHFHWSEIGFDNGTEHAINDEKFALEVHFIHRLEEFSNLEVAVKDEMGILIIAQLVKLNNDETKSLQLDNITFHGNSSGFILRRLMFEMGQLITSEPKGFFRYRGTLTKPSCKTVLWVVLKDYLYISEKQMEKLRVLNKNKQFDHNIRFIQEYNETVYEIDINSGNINIILLPMFILTLLSILAN